MTVIQPVRKLTIIAKDPGLRIGSDGLMVFARVDVPAEILAPGPTGYRIKVRRRNDGAGARSRTRDDEDGAAVGLCPG